MLPRTARRDDSLQLLQSLELRQHLSVTLDDAGVLHVEAEENVASRIVVSLRGPDKDPATKPNGVTVHVNGQLMGTFRARHVRALRVVGSELADAINTTGLDFRPTTVLALAGDDTVSIGDGRSLVLGGAGNDT